MSKISIPGVLTGAAFSFFVLAVFGFIITLVLGMTTGIKTAADIEAFYASSPGILLTMRLLNGAAAVVVLPAGGYLAAKAARKGPLLNGTLSSFAYVLSGIYAISSYPQNTLSGVLMIAAAPFLGLLGGYLYQRRIRNFLQVQA